MYDSPHQFEPLFPSDIPKELTDKANSVSGMSLQLAGAGHETARSALRGLVRTMNAYYSNRIEGQAAHPLNIERALNGNFASNQQVARLQRLALAHIQAEIEMKDRARAGELPALSGFLVAVHKALYGRLDESDCTTKEGLVIVPGGFRAEEVQVGRHIPPKADSIPRFLARMDEVYGRRLGWEMRLIATACAHHRAAWVHPFTDGNGRAIRLQTDCALWALTDGLWSPSRGLARALGDYHARLANADQPRQGDYDGRGNLSTKGLLQWVDFFLGVCEDEVRFMAKMLDLDAMKRRIEGLMRLRAPQDSRYRVELIAPLHYVFAAGPVSRGDFGRMTGLEERTARKSISLLVEDGLLVSDTKLGPVRFGLPLNALQYLLPELYPEAATELE